MINTNPCTINDYISMTHILHLSGTLAMLDMLITCNVLNTQLIIGISVWQYITPNIYTVCKVINLVCGDFYANGSCKWFPATNQRTEIKCFLW